MIMKDAGFQIPSNFESNTFWDKPSGRAFSFDQPLAVGLSDYLRESPFIYHCQGNIEEFYEKELAR
jgi:hypothetical protein